MTFGAHHFGKILLIVVAALGLSGCFVTSEHPVEGTGPDADPALAGAWRGLDEDGKPEPGVYMHGILNRNGEGVTLALIEKDDLMVVRGTTVKTGSNTILNGVLVPVPGLGKMDDDEKEALGYHILLYKVSKDRLSLYLLSHEVMADLVEGGKIKGKVQGSGASKSVRLTATPEELGAFFAAPDAQKYFQDKPVQLVRLRQ